MRCRREGSFPTKKRMSGVELTGLFEKAKELDQLRKDQEEVLAEINKIHKKLQNSKLASSLPLLSLSHPPPPPS